MTRVIAVIAILAVYAASVSSADARGGWDGNGLKVNGIDRAALGVDGVAQTGVQIDNCAAGAESTAARLSYVELPAQTGASPRLPLEVSKTCSSAD